VATLPYIPRDTLALTLEGTKEFPDRQRLMRFVRRVTGKSERAAAALLDQVAVGIEAAIHEAARYARQYPDARNFARLLTKLMRSGLERLTTPS